MKQVPARGVSRLNALLHCELSAVEIYNLAISRVGDDYAEESFALSRLAIAHQTQSNLLREAIHRRGGEVRAGGPDWAPYARAIADSPTIFGDVMALEALREGELRGLEEYRAALADENMDEAGRDLLIASLIPGKERHIAILDALIRRIQD
jgi:hypothetical protein